MVYELLIDAASGRPDADGSGLYRYEFRGYRHGK
ncbi:hypothetical protein GA0070607_4618 [Micromonospora coriariae]|uniref:Uncharacterized protein n=1 Tax=Micromonospora coriariae TaxID=285665 RepID=A0A1C4X3H9_9ACTN|nr:hypothetical protein GA0070607_4618 [Micromonospora coriariae]